MRPGKPSAAAGGIPDAILHDAAEWMALLASGEADQRDLDACAQWRNRHPDHARAWQRAEHLFARLQALPASAALQALDHPHDPSRRTLLRNVLALALAVPAAGLAWRHFSIDHRTAKGQRLTLALSDGSQLQLDADSAVRVDLDGAVRRLALLRGRMHLRTSIDAARGERALEVATGHGLLHTRDAVFGADVSDDGLVATVERGVLDVMDRTRRFAGNVSAQQVARIIDGSIVRLRALDDADTAWQHGLLHADGERLDVFLEALSRYRRGWLRCDPAVAGLRISGVFRTDDPDAVLAVVAHTLPVEVVHRGPWTLIGPA